jgi:hypothetical protein
MMKTFPETNVKVRLNGVVYWLVESTLFAGRCIAPLEHCDTLGNPVVLADAYAHLGPDGLIRRYCSVIGSADDLELVVQ